MTQPLWWQTGIVYHIYPRSYQDTNGDGIGDLNGVRLRLDYLQDLGVDAIWLSPIYPSPMADFGYDISDYRDISPLFGTLEDFDALLAAAHERGLRVIIDLVPNHTSQEHVWFRQSRASRQNPRRDWYIWRDPAPDGGPPNNWLSEFGGSAWTFDETTGQYYYHHFLKEQPDLNWRNPDVVAAIHDVMRFWLSRGVDGFRVDVLSHPIKDLEFRDNPVNPNYREGQDPYWRLLPVYTVDLPDIHGVVAGLRKVIDEYPSRVLIGEVYLPVERLSAYYGTDLQGAHLPFNFALVEMAWNAEAIGAYVRAYEASLPQGAWPNWVLGNHDRKRVVGRMGRAQARVAMMALLSLRGTPTLYYGDEIGMAQVNVPPERVQDPWEKNVPGYGLGRDGARTPMQWDGSAHAGFSIVAPWLPVGDDYVHVNVASELTEKGSMLDLTRRLIRLRRSRSALSHGIHVPVESAGPILAYGRQDGTDRVLVVLNLSHAPAVLKARGFHGDVLLSTYCDRESESMADRIALRADEGVIIRVHEDTELPEALKGPEEP